MAGGTKRFGSVGSGGPGGRDRFDEPTRAQTADGTGQPARPRRESSGGEGGGMVGVGARGQQAPREPKPPARTEHTAITRAPLPRESFLPEGSSSTTVMMQAARRVDLPAHLVQASEPPEISITEHSLEGGPFDDRMELVLDPDSERSASFRVMRHHLLEQGRPQVVVVSSPRVGEGKTTTAVNLAMALSECDRAKVLLVEATVRKPQLAAMFRFVPPWCFAEQLAAHRHQPLLPWSLVRVPSMSLHVAAVNPRVQQSQLLDAPAFAIAMERLRLAGFDHIVIDAPSVIGSADVNLIQDAADGVILVTQARRTTARDLRRATEQLKPTKIVGTVLLQ